MLLLRGADFFRPQGAEIRTVAYAACLFNGFHSPEPLRLRQRFHGGRCCGSRRGFSHLPTMAERGLSACRCARVTNRLCVCQAWDGRAAAGSESGAGGGAARRGRPVMEVPRLRARAKPSPWQPGALRPGGGGMLSPANGGCCPGRGGGRFANVGSLGQRSHRLPFWTFGNEEENCD